MAYDKEEITINGTNYKRVTKKDENSNPLWQKDVPLVDKNVHASGCHLIFNNTKQNHFDHNKAGSKWREYINQEGK